MAARTRTGIMNDKAYVPAFPSISGPALTGTVRSGGIDPYDAVSLAALGWLRMHVRPSMPACPVLGGRGQIRQPWQTRESPPTRDGDVDAIYGYHCCYCLHDSIQNRAKPMEGILGFACLRSKITRWRQGGPGSWACRIDPDRLGSAHRFPSRGPLSTLAGIDTGVDFTACPPPLLLPVYGPDTKLP